MSETGAVITVLFDATRLIARGAHSTPTGIDRVDLAYVDALRRTPGFALRLLRFDALGPRVIDAQHGERLLDAVLQRWQSPAATGDSKAYPAVRDWLQNEALTMRPARIIAAGARSKGLRAQMQPMLTRLRSTRLRREATPAPSVYLNTSHGQLYRPVVSRWLKNSGIPAVFFVHDLIPIDYPEYNRPREPARHEARLRVIAGHASQVLVNSLATQTALQRYLQSQQLRVPPISVLPLGVDDRPANTTATALQPARPYFVVLSTIEPRKNHQLLLNLWRRLVEQDADAAPRLVVIGRRGWQNETVFNLLDRCPALARHVIECGDLADHEVSQLIRGARAVLMPSFIEGYGLPVAEALALGTPVLASDIAAHREIGGDHVEYLDPLDGSGWLRAITDYASEASARRQHYLQALPRYQPIRWTAHLSAALPLLRDTTSLP